MPGKIGKYNITRTLGSGGSCKVKLGDDGVRKYAIKIMNDDMDAETRQLVMTEVQALKCLGTHPNVI